jgi:hypothetical protein
VAHYIVDYLAHRAGYQFTLERKRTLTKRARGRLTCFANANHYRFVCSQRNRVKLISTDKYGRTRNRDSLIKTCDCTGTISVTFPSKLIPCDFDFALEHEHPFHPGRPYFGVPKHIRKWIYDNPRSTPRRLREDLLKAIQKGEIRGAAHRFLTTALIHYWWRRSYRERNQPTDDAWENMRLFLENHESVLSLNFSRLTP